MSTTPPVAAYMRVSTLEQDTDSQRAQMEAWLTSHNMMATWYIDHGESSLATSRPAFARMMTALRERRHTTVLCWNIDRLNRWNVKEHIAWRLELDRLDIEVVSVTQPEACRLDSFMDLVRELIEAEGRRAWIETHIKRVRAGIAARRAKGLRIGRSHQKKPPSYWEMIAQAAAGQRSMHSILRETSYPQTTVASHVRSAKANPVWLEARRIDSVRG